MLFAKMAAVTVRGMDFDALKKQWPVHLMKQVNPPYTNRANGIPMVTVNKREKPCFGGLSAFTLFPELKGHL
jgi:hypothetical protein